MTLAQLACAVSKRMESPHVKAETGPGTRLALQFNGDAFTQTTSSVVTVMQARRAKVAGSVELSVVAVGSIPWAPMRNACEASSG